MLLIQTNHHVSNEFAEVKSHHQEHTEIDTRYKDAVDDADLLIAQTAVDCALSSEVIVIGEDTDLFVLLIHTSINSANGLFSNRIKWQ
jgi:hypothetical protein